ncbi:ImmA/IrrE family metallo-endopeptidase [Desulfovibrio sp. XJ01]|nr:ImmA/IrrE family metallo-endopeptidase [Nitratidesulfovibrio liaohensis]
MSVESSLHYYFQHVSPARISMARERAGLTKKKLAELLDKKPSAVTQFESGKSGLAFETFTRLVQALKIHPAYLTTLLPESPQLKIETCHFRANRSVTQAERYQAVRYAQDVLAIYRALERRGVTFPDVAFSTYEGPELSERKIEEYSITVRKNLGLGLGPILNMAELLESIGVFIILLPCECAKLDAFATWIDDRPCIMITADSPASRMQFDYGHEFAHILLDENRSSGDPLTERIANRFASAFLMPYPTFSTDCPRKFSLSVFISVKDFWHTSIAASMYRARQLDIMSERNYRSGIISLTREGYRRSEPKEFDRPLPTSLDQALQLVSSDTTISDLANEIGLYQEQLIDVLKTQGISSETISSLSPAPQKAKIINFPAR